jgi:hypothetical protein
MRRCAHNALAIIFLGALLCFAIGAIVLIKDIAHPAPRTGCPSLPPDFSEEQVLGTWVAESSVPERITDSLTFNPDGTYSQVVISGDPPERFVGQPRRWSLEPADSGIAYLHMEDMRDCGADVDPDCSAARDVDIPWADVCQDRWFPLISDELVLTVQGFAQPDPAASRQFCLKLYRGFEASPWVYGYQP